MKIENTKAQMRKGILEYCILLLLSKTDAYASDIISNFKEAKLIVVEGTLYPLLTRLKNAKLLSYHWEESTQGPPRKYYNITEEGKFFLEQLDESWIELMNAVELVKQQSKTQ
jgi:PadR family transcriptional regulator